MSTTSAYYSTGASSIISRPTLRGHSRTHAHTYPRHEWPPHTFYLLVYLLPFTLFGCLLFLGLWSYSFFGLEVLCATLHDLIYFSCFSAWDIVHSSSSEFSGRRVYLLMFIDVVAVRGSYIVDRGRGWCEWNPYGRACPYGRGRG